MAAAVYLEQYLDSLEGLPLELQRNFSLMRDVDRRAQDVMKEIDKQADSFLASVNKLSSDDKKRRFSKMEQLFSKSQEFGDEKVQLAFQTYEMVDKHIRKLDNDLARFEAELNDKNLQVEATPVEKGKKKRKKKEEETTSSKGQKRKKKEASKDNTSLLSPISMHSQPSDVLDMPVDPNEPTYCICHQVSYGEMIGCDNQDCPIEWFHFQCVNLTTKPKGKWYCPRCSEQRKKR